MLVLNKYHARVEEPSLTFSPNINPNLIRFTVVIASNEILHDRNVVLSNNIILNDMIEKLEPSLNTFHFCSDGCAGQFHSKKNGFRSFSFYSAEIN